MGAQITQPISAGLGEGIGGDGKIAAGAQSAWLGVGESGVPGGTLRKRAGGHGNGMRTGGHGSRVSFMEKG